MTESKDSPSLREIDTKAEAAPDTATGTAETPAASSETTPPARKNNWKKMQKNRPAAAAAIQKDKTIQELDSLNQKAEKPTNNYLSTIADRRKKRSRKLTLQFTIFVLIPTLCAGLYYSFWASNIYQSISAFNIQSSESRSAGGIESILGSFGGSSTSRDAMTAQGYILSRDMLRRLDKEHKIIAHYQDPSRDYVSRLSSTASFEDAYEYYLSMVELEYDTASGLLTLSVKSYNAEMSHRIATTILKYCEDAVNKLSERIRADQVAFAEANVAKSEKRLKAAQVALLKLQQKGAEFSPDRSAASLMTVTGQLESELAKARTELNELRAVMAPTAPKVLELSQRVQSLQRQIKQENKRLIGTEEHGLGSSIAQFETAMMEKSFAEKGYATAMASLELSSIEAVKQNRYLATISSPSLPDAATFPKRIIGIIKVFLLMAALFGIGSLLVAATREHARI